MEKIVLVTGASSGIGEAIARHLAKNGYTVYGTSRRERKNDPDGLKFLQMDVDDESSVKKGIATLLEQTGRIDAVINSAGLGIIGSVEEVPIEMVKGVFETNFYGVMRVCQAVLPSMRTQGSGTIINVSSIAGEIGLPFRGFYAASKFALEGMTEALRLEMAPFGIKVVILQPGGFNTNIGQSRPTHDLGENSPYHRYLSTIRKMIDKEVDHAPTPERIGPLVERILKKSSPGMRYKVGALLEKFSPFAKKMFPWALYESLILGFHKMK